MSLSRREFIQLFGVAVASMLVTHCKPFKTATPVVACYQATAVPLTPTAGNLPLPALERLRICWMSFSELAQATIDEFNQPGPVEVEHIPETVIEGTEPARTPKPSTENAFGVELSARHRQALDELIARGELTPGVADLIQEAYGAAVYHVWRSNASITCYEPVIVDYAPSSAGVLVQQADLLSEIAGDSNIDPATLEKARTALEHDMAFYALTDEEVNNLYEHLVNEWQNQQQDIPGFESVDLEVTPDAKAAAQFILILLIGK